MLRSIQIGSELDTFLKLVTMTGAKTGLEIGSYECGTGMVLALHMGDESRVVGVDLPESEGGTKAEFEEEAVKQTGGRFTLIRGKSTAYATKDAVMAALDGREVDVLLIDAEHTQAAAMNDYETYKGLISENGIIAFHDICMDELWPMWCWLRGQRHRTRSIEIIHDLRQGGCGLGILLGR